MGEVDESPPNHLSIDNVVATFEIDITKPEMSGEIWFRELLADSLRTIGVAHSEATQIMVIFRKP